MYKNQHTTSHIKKIRPQILASKHTVYINIIIIKLNRKSLARLSVAD